MFGKVNATATTTTAAGRRGGSTEEHGDTIRFTSLSSPPLSLSSSSSLIASDSTSSSSSSSSSIHKEQQQATPITDKRSIGTKGNNISMETTTTTITDDNDHDIDDDEEDKVHSEEEEEEDAIDDYDDHDDITIIRIQPTNPKIIINPHCSQNCFYIQYRHPSYTTTSSSSSTSTITSNTATATMEDIQNLLLLAIYIHNNNSNRKSILKSASDYHDDDVERTLVQFLQQNSFEQPFPLVLLNHAKGASRNQYYDYNETICHMLDTIWIDHNNSTDTDTTIVDDYNIRLIAMGKLLGNTVAMDDDDDNDDILKDDTKSIPFVQQLPQLQTLLKITNNSDASNNSTTPTTILPTTVVVHAVITKIDRQLEQKELRDSVKTSIPKKEKRQQQQQQRIVSLSPPPFSTALNRNNYHHHHHSLYQGRHRSVQQYPLRSTQVVMEEDEDDIVYYPNDNNDNHTTPFYSHTNYNNYDYSSYVDDDNDDEESSEDAYTSNTNIHLDAYATTSNRNQRNTAALFVNDDDDDVDSILDDNDEQEALVSGTSRHQQYSRQEQYQQQQQQQLNRLVQSYSNNSLVRNIQQEQGQNSNNRNRNGSSRHRHHRSQQQEPRIPLGLDSLRVLAGLNREDVTTIRLYFNHDIDVYLEQQPNIIQWSRNVSPNDTIYQRRLQEEAWMNVQGPYSEFRYNLNLPIASNMRANSHIQLPTTRQPRIVPFNNTHQQHDANTGTDRSPLLALPLPPSSETMIEIPSSTTNDRRNRYPSINNYDTSNSTAGRRNIDTRTGGTTTTGAAALYRRNPRDGSSSTILPLHTTTTNETSTTTATNGGGGTSNMIVMLGTNREFVYGFVFGSMVGSCMLLWLWIPTVSYRQKLGILFGYAIHITVTMISKSFFLLHHSNNIIDNEHISQLFDDPATTFNGGIGSNYNNIDHHYSKNFLINDDSLQLGE